MENLIKTSFPQNYLIQNHNQQKPWNWKNKNQTKQNKKTFKNKKVIS